MPRRRMGIKWALAGLCLLAGCGGGGSPASPTPTSTPTPPAFPAGATLAFVSGLTDTPVGGASVTIGTASYTTNESGQITLSQAAAAGVRATVLAAGFFDRQTLVRSGNANRFALWPRTPGTGLDAPWTEELAYTDGIFCCPAAATHSGRLALGRVRSGTRIQLVIIPASLQRDVVVRSAQLAADLANVASEGRVAFQYTAAPTAGPRIEVKIQPGLCPEGSSACLLVDQDAAGYITGGSIVFPGEPTESATYALYLAQPYALGELGYLGSTFTHELGHVLGLQHCLGPDRLGMMSVSAGGAYGYAYFSSYRDFAPEEKRTLKLLYQRPAGNRFPDDDSQIGASAAAESAVVCRLLPPS